MHRVLCILLFVAATAVCAGQDTGRKARQPADNAQPAATQPGKPEASEPREAEKPAEPPDPVQTPTEGMEVITTESGLKYIDIKVGDGEQPEPDAAVTVHYSGWLDDGTLFDSSVKKGQPYSHRLNQRGIVAGWTEGVGSMNVGGKRKLIIPPDLGYGDRKYGKIPANSTLTFEIELLSVTQPPKPTPFEGLREQSQDFVLKWWDLKVGEGEPVQPDSQAEMHYSIWLGDGKLLDSTYLRDNPGRFPVSNLFSGWSEGMLTMKVGGKRRIEIPPALGFGRHGTRGGIPPNATLIIEMELLSVENPPSEEELAEKAAEEAKKKAEAAKPTTEESTGQHDHEH